MGRNYEETDIHSFKKQKFSTSLLKDEDWRILDMFKPSFSKNDSGILWDINLKILLLEN